MEFPMASSTIVATILSIVVAGVLLQILNTKRTKKANRNPPQAKGAWPIIGHLHLLGGSHELLHMVLGNMAEKYGPIFTIKLGVRQALVVSHAEIAKECFTTNDKVFANRPKGQATEFMGCNYAMFDLSPYGNYWQQVRKVTMLEVLSQRRVEMLGHIRVSKVRASMKDIYDAWVKNKESENSDTVKVEMQQWFGNLVLNVVVRTISGKRFSPNDEKGVRLQAVIRKFFELAGVVVVSDFIPYLKCLDLGGYEKSMKMTGKEMDHVIQGWLEEHNREQEYSHEGNQTFIGVLMSILQDASKEDFPGFDHDTVIKATCQQILAASLDTTSVTLTWALSLLLNNPKTLEIVQNELDEHVGRQRLVEESDMKNLVYLEVVIKESLRLYPAGPLSVPHESIEDCIVGGYSISKGTILLINLWKMHRDPNIWSDPYEFRPERFLTSQKGIDVKGKNFELLPFGSGRRMCPSVSFALQVLRLTLASLMQQFVVKKPSNEPIEMSESLGLSNSKATPLDVFLARRLSLDMYGVLISQFQIMYVLHTRYPTPNHLTTSKLPYNYTIWQGK